MPSLIETLIDYEPDLLAMLAEQWGVEQDLSPVKNLPKQVAQRLGEETLFSEILQALPQPALSALLRLARSQGRLPLAQFERDFGSLREMGAARREKIRPDRHPQSITEMLFYKGLIARAFFKEGAEAREFFYIPEEFQRLLQAQLLTTGEGAPALTQYDAERVFAAQDNLLDHSCSLLAALRLGIDAQTLSLQNPPIPAPFLLDVLRAGDLIDEHNTPDPAAIGAFLEASRAQAFSRLVHVWLSSPFVDETRLLTDLDFEGGMRPSPQLTRQKVIALALSLPGDSWTNLDEFVEWVRAFQPDILRSGGEYEAWIIQQQPGGRFLKGFQHWQDVEGRLLREMVTGPLFWMGLLDLGAKYKSKKAAFLRPSKWADDLTKGREVSYPHQEAAAFRVEKDGSLLISRAFPLSLRYQIARFCEWGAARQGNYVYQLSPPALLRAKQQGLQPSQLIALLHKYGQKPLPAPVLAALERWKEHELEAVLEKMLLLRVRSADVLDQLMATNAKTHILSRLNDTTAVVKSGSVVPLRKALLELGLLADVRLEV